MIVHRLKGVTAAHGQVPGLPGFFRVAAWRRNPPEGELKTPQVCERLGVTKEEARALVYSGRLKGDVDSRGNVTVPSPELETFVDQQLEPVELEVKEHRPNPADEPSAPAAVASAAVAAAPPAKPEVDKKGAAAAPQLVASSDEEEDEEAGWSPTRFVAPCPGCDTQLAIADGVLAVECPECGKRLDVVATDENADEDDRHAVRVRPESGLRLFGFRIGRLGGSKS